jgi:CBS domain-containing protein
LGKQIAPPAEDKQVNKVLRRQSGAEAYDLTHPKNLEGIDMTTCGEIMTKEVVCCVPEDTVEHAATLMKTEDVGPMPVVESHQSRRLLGILTDRDIVMKVIAEGRDAKSTMLRDIMTVDPVTCREDDDIDDAIDRMADHQVRRIPVVDEGNHILGIISQADVATRISKSKKTGDVVEKISK